MSDVTVAHPSIARGREWTPREPSPLVDDNPVAEPTPSRRRQALATTTAGGPQGVVFAATIADPVQKKLATTATGPVQGLELEFNPLVSDPPPSLPIRKRGRPPRAPPPQPEWSDPTSTAARGGISIAQLWRLVARGLITPPSYLGPKCPRFHNETFDDDLKKLRATPQQNEAGRRAAKLAEARARARAARGIETLAGEALAIADRGTGRPGNCQGVRSSHRNPTTK
jgi:hypothetical protein